MTVNLLGWTEEHALHPAAGYIIITGRDAGNKQRWSVTLRAKPIQDNQKGNWSLCGGSNSNSSIDCIFTPKPMRVNAQAAQLTSSVSIQIQFD